MLIVFNLLRTRTYWNHEQKCKSYSIFYLLSILIQEVLKFRSKVYLEKTLNSRISTSQTMKLSFTDKKANSGPNNTVTSCIRSVVKGEDRFENITLFKIQHFVSKVNFFVT